MFNTKHCFKPFDRRAGMGMQGKARMFFFGGGERFACSIVVDVGSWWPSPVQVLCPCLDVCVGVVGLFLRRELRCSSPLKNKPTTLEYMSKAGTQHMHWTGPHPFSSDNPVFDWWCVCLLWRPPHSSQTLAAVSSCCTPSTPGTPLLPTHKQTATARVWGCAPSPAPCPLPLPQLRTGQRRFWQTLGCRL